MFRDKRYLNRSCPMYTMSQNLFTAIIKIPFEMAADGSITPHQDRYDIEFHKIAELPPIQTTDHSELLSTLLHSEQDTSSSEPKHNISFRRSRPKIIKNYSIKKRHKITPSVVSDRVELPEEQE